MSAAFVMCVLLSACKTSHASNHSSEFYSSKDSIAIHRNYGKATYQVNDKTFTYEQLTDSQKKDILKMEESLDKLEIAIEIDSEAMEDEAEKLEDSLENLEFNGHSINVSEITKRIEVATRNMEVKMRVLETKMRAMETAMPIIDSAKIKEITRKAEEYKDLLIEISETI